MRGMVPRAAYPPIISDTGGAQSSYSNPIFSSTRYSTISPFSTTALDFTTSTVWMFRTVRDAVATACRAASLHDRGLVPTISRMMITPNLILLSPSDSPICPV